MGIKRSVSHTFNTQINMMSAQMLSSTMQQQANDNIARDEMKALEENASVAAASAPASSETSKKENVDRNIMFVRGETQSRSVEEAQKTQLAENPDEIDLDDDDDDDEDDDENGGENGSNGNGDGPIVERSGGKVEKQAIPAEVFGSLKKDDD